MSGVEHGLRERLLEELRAYAVVSAYLYVCIRAVVVYKAAVLRGVGVEFAPVGFAAVKALILGKFALLGRGVGIGERGASRTVLGRIARKTLLFLVVLLALSVVEELVVGQLHGKSPGQVMAELGDDPFLMIGADALVLLLVIAPFIALLEVSAALGPGVLWRLLRSPPRGPGGG